MLIYINVYKDATLSKQLYFYWGRNVFSNIETKRSKGGGRRVHATLTRISKALLASIFSYFLWPLFHLLHSLSNHTSGATVKHYLILPKEKKFRPAVNVLDYFRLSYQIYWLFFVPLFISENADGKKGEEMLCSFPKELERQHFAKIINQLMD